MMCDSCKAFARREKRLRMRQAEGRGTNGETVHRRHVAKVRTPRCEYPETCTCQHKPVGKYTK